LTGERRLGAATVEVTVVVATRNRATLLPACLDALASQRTDARFEVVVVDNGSQDATGDLVRERARADARFRVVQEPVAGLSRAKNAGLASARGEFVLFTDDDVVPCDGWIAAFAGFLRRSGGTPLLAGGPVLPVAHDLGGWPEWVGTDTADLPRLYHGSRQRPLAEFEWLWGANMGTRRAVMESIGGFDESLGNTGDRRGTFEDVELVQRVTARGGECWYVPAALVHHRTPPAATRPRALAGKAFARGANDMLRSRRAAYVEPAMPVPRSRPAAMLAAPALLAGWMLCAALFRVTRGPRPLAIGRRLAWGAGWCIAAAAPEPSPQGPRAARRLADLGRRVAIALTPA
jgi:glucosyl-dolichyl phosphate glucuronosyltransferase